MELCFHVDLSKTAPEPSVTADGGTGRVLGIYVDMWEGLRGGQSSSVPHTLPRACIAFINQTLVFFRIFSGTLSRTSLPLEMAASLPRA